MTFNGILTLTFMVSFIIVTTLLFCTVVAMKRYMKDKKEKEIRNNYNAFISEYGNSPIIL